MTTPLFVHLRVHSEFSISDGLTRIEELIRIAKADGQGAIALTDAHNLFGLIKFYTKRKSKKKKKKGQEKARKKQEKGSGLSSSH